MTAADVLRERAIERDEQARNLAQMDAGWKVEQSTRRIAAEFRALADLIDCASAYR
jgi:hypothetical protein